MESLDTIPLSLLVRYILERPPLLHEFEERSGISRTVLALFAIQKTVPEFITLLNRVSSTNESLGLLTDEVQGGVAPVVWMAFMVLRYLTGMVDPQEEFQFSRKDALGSLYPKSNQTYGSCPLADALGRCPPPAFDNTTLPGPFVFPGFSSSPGVSPISPAVNNTTLTASPGPFGFSSRPDVSPSPFVYPTDVAWSPKWMVGTLAVVSGVAGIVDIMKSEVVYSYLFARSNVSYAATYAYVDNMLVAYQYGTVNGSLPGWYFGNHTPLDDARVDTLPKVFRDEVLWKTSAGAGTPGWPWRSYKDVDVPVRWKKTLNTYLVRWNPLGRLLNLFFTATNAEYAVTVGRATDDRDIYFAYETSQWKFQNHAVVNNLALVPPLLLAEARWKLEQGAGGAWRSGTYKTPDKTGAYMEWLHMVEIEYGAAPALQTIQVPWQALVSSLTQTIAHAYDAMPVLDVRALVHKAFPTKNRVVYPPLEFYQPPALVDRLVPYVPARVVSLGGVQYGVPLDGVVPTAVSLGGVLGINTTEEGRRSAIDVFAHESTIEQQVFQKLQEIEARTVLIRQKIALVRKRLDMLTEKVPTLSAKKYRRLE